MILTIFIVIISLLFLVTIHELGHFILAKKFGVKVEEFGIGIPPKIIGKKIGETVYSLNWLPLGAFVKLYGEEERIEEPRSFTQKPIWQRALIVLGGVVSFWIIAVILISIIAGIWGIPMAIDDEANQYLINPKVQILEVAKDSPAEKTGLRIGDAIQSLKTKDAELTTTKVKGVTDFIDTHRGEEVTLTIERGKEVLDVSLIPRPNPPEGEGAMGVALVRSASRVYPWPEAIVQGFSITKDQTLFVIFTFGNLIAKVIRGIPIPPGFVELKGLPGISEMMVQTLERGIGDYLWLLAMISIFLAIFNILPIPALDGGKLLFLGIEKIRKRPVNQKTEQNITTFFFFIIIALGIWVNIKDIVSIFKRIF
jgi:regulator of sigma E protease